MVSKRPENRLTIEWLNAILVGTGVIIRDATRAASGQVIR